ATAGSRSDPPLAPSSPTARLHQVSSLGATVSRIARPAAAPIVKPVDVDEVARRARGENFPVASLLFPRELRPHLRAVYGYCRLVDILGDEVEGDRLAALDELEREGGRRF